MTSEVMKDTVVDGRYRIVRRIGSGGMADVYLCEDAHLGRRVALKILHRRFAQDEEFVERFRREAKAAAGLQHPNVVAIYDRGDYEGTYYIAMEYLQGRSLKAVIQRDAPLPPPRAVKLAKQILAALSYAHRDNIIHRDIKPHNIAVDDEDRVKVTDFGIARAGGSQITEVGSIMGTAQYLSPEQAQGRQVTEASDLYSVGVVLYEMLTGEVPFRGETAVTIALKHVNEEAEPIRSLARDAPEALESVVSKALDKDPEHRFASAEAFLHTLERVEAGLVQAEIGDRTAAWDALEVSDGGEETKRGQGKEATRPPGHSEARGSDGKQAEARSRDGKQAVGGRGVNGFPSRQKSGGRRYWIAGTALALAAVAAGAFFLTGPDQVAVPMLIGLDVEDARSSLERDNLAVDVKRVSSPAAIGEVIEQSPLAKEQVDEGSSVLLTVSRGPGLIEMPDLAGQTEQAAEIELKKAKLKAMVQRQDSADVKEGLVIETDPSANETVAIGSQVALVVSKGPATVELPSVVGLNRDDAVSTLKGVDLNVVVDREDSSEDEDTVIKQSPVAGTKVDENTSIAITVSNGKGAKVPGVVGLSRGDASYAIKRNDLTVEVKEKITYSVDRDNIVLSQSPSKGDERKKGETVTITVGKFEPQTPASGVQ